MGKRRLKQLVTMFLLAAGVCLLASQVRTARADGEYISIEETFPDEEFRTNVSVNIDGAVDGIQDGYLSPDEIEYATTIIVRGTNISSLQGIEVFTNLNYLNCGDNNLTELDLSANTALIWLYCDNNRLTSLTLPQDNVVEEIHCNNNLFTELDVSGCSSLGELQCVGNQLTSLTLGASISKLMCYNNPLSEVDLTPTFFNNYISQSNPEDSYYDPTGWYEDPSTYLHILSWGDYGELMTDSYTRVITSSPFTYYTVSFDSCGGSDVAAVAALAGRSIDKPADPTREGYDFIGWYTDDGYTNRFCFYNFNGNEMTPVTDDITLYAKWIVPVKIDSTTFPDPKFLDYVYTLDLDGDGYLSGEEISYVKNISIAWEGVCSLEGIEVFTDLEELSCGYNNLISLDVSANKALKTLSCEYNELTELVLSANTKLDSLSCYNCQLTSLVLCENGALTWLACRNNNLKSLDLRGNTKITHLYCGFNELEELNLAGCTVLTELDCMYNALTALDLTENVMLEKVDCRNNQLTELTLSNANARLNRVECEFNNLSTLDVSDVYYINYLFKNSNTEHECWIYSDPKYNVVDNWSHSSGYYLSVDSTTQVVSDPALTYVTVSFESNGGSEVANIITLPNQPIAKPADPTGDNKDFFGWYTDENLLTPFRFVDDNSGDADLVTENITLYAKWHTTVTIDSTTFPDDSFRESVVRSFDTNDDGLLTGEEIEAVTRIEAMGYEIESLQGIEVFTNLEFLYCGYNKLSSLDVSNNKALTSLNCEDNQLTSLTLGELPNLTALTCYDNQLTSLVVSGCPNLVTLTIANNLLTSINVQGNGQLTEIFCQGNQLSELNVSSNSALTTLNCEDNSISELNLGACSALMNLYCSGNQLAELDVSGNTNLGMLECSANQLTKLTIGSNSKLHYLMCVRNQLSGVDISDAPVLSELVNNLDASQEFDYDEATGTAVACTNWSEDYNVLYVDSFTKVTADPELQYFTVTFNSNGGSEVASVSTLPNQVIDMPADPTPVDPTLEGKTFVGWYADAALTKKFHFGWSGDIVTDNITLYAKWFTPVVIEDTFPDYNFRAYVSNNIDTDSDGVLYAEEVEAVTSLDVSYCEIASLEGIEVFSELTYLCCNGNMLTSLDMSGNPELAELYCLYNQLTELNVSSNSRLWELDCSDNALTELVVSGNEGLVYLRCCYNQLTSLDVSSNLSLQTLWCENNKLSSLVFGQNTALSILGCYGNCLASIDLRGATELNNLIQDEDPVLDTIYNTYDRQILQAVWGNRVSVDTTTEVIVNPALTYYTVTFNSNGGSEVPSAKVIPGFVISRPADPVKGNMDVYGWYLDGAFTRPFRFGYDGDPVDEDITLYAKWVSPVVIATAFPDEIFRQFVSDSYDTDQDGKLSVGECGVVTLMDVGNLGIASLQGIEAFYALQTLYCNGNELTSLDLRQNKELICVSCGDNALTQLDVSTCTKLETLICPGNSLTALNIKSNSELTSIDCEGNSLTELDLSGNAKLNYLWCRDNELAELDLSGCPAIIALHCEANNLASLDITSCTELTALVQHNERSREEHYLSGTYYMTDCWRFGESSKWLSVDYTTQVITTPALNYITVTFNSKGGSEIPAISILPGFPIAEPEEPTRGDDTFIAWYLDEECTNWFKFGEFNGHAVTDSITLYAAWDEHLPEIWMQPDTETYCEVGDYVSFYIGVTGTEPLTYQWQAKSPNATTWSNSTQTGANTDTLTVKTTVNHHNYQYRCIVTNGEGKSVASAAGTLKVAPRITESPLGTTVCAGDSVEFSVAVNGKAPLTYQWQAKAPNSTKWSNSSQSGAKTATLTVKTTINHDGYQYRCVVKDVNGMETTSDVAILYILPALSIVTQPEAQEVVVGETATFTVEVNGTEPITYQWQAKSPSATTWSNSTQPGANTATLSVTTNVNHNGYQYRCVVTDGYTYQEITEAVKLTVLPKITTQPSNVSVTVGETAIFTVAATGKGTLKYQWQAKSPSATTWSDSTQSGAKTATLSVKTNKNHNGYQYRCIVTDGNGKTSVSDAATLTVTTALAITTQPTGVSVSVGETAKFTVKATGTGTLTYQWQAKGPKATTWSNSTQSGAKTATLSVKTNSNHNGYQYRCIVTDATGKSVTSNAATLTLKKELKITAQPTATTVFLGETAKFTVAATGTTPLTYQWQAKGPKATTWSNSTQTGAKTATLSVKTNSNHNGYQYRCIITDADGNTVTSNAVTLSVTTELTITSQPSDKSVTIGSNAVFSVTAVGTTPLTYQWQAKGPKATTWSNSTQSGAQTATLTVKTNSNHNGYQYRCIITDADGNQVTSGAATLSVQ